MAGFNFSDPEMGGVGQGGPGGGEQQPTGLQRTNRYLGGRREVRWGFCMNEGGGAAQRGRGMSPHPTLSSSEPSCPFAFMCIPHITTRTGTRAANN